MTQVLSDEEKLHKRQRLETTILLAGFAIATLSGIFMVLLIIIMVLNWFGVITIT